MVEAKNQAQAHTEFQEDGQFSRDMTDILHRFTTAKEWADLSNLLEQLKKSFEKYPKKAVPKKKELAKRLSQCLAPELSMIHKQTLDVYTEIFKRTLESYNSQKEADGDELDSGAVFGQDMGLFISNLYNFYQVADFQVKKSFLTFISKYILKFEKELLMSLSSFLLCMLPALDDSNEDMIMDVHRILRETEKIVGTSKFYGEVWKTMLRSPRAREMAIKFLDAKIPKEVDEACTLNSQSDSQQMPIHKKGKVYISKYNLVIVNGKMIVQTLDYDSRDDDELPHWALQEKQMLRSLQEGSDEETQQRALFYFYYPNKNNLVINALLTGLHDLEHNLVVRATFDFLISHIQINTGFLEQEERVRLVEGALLTLTERDFASQKKFFKWCFEHLEEKASINDPAVKSCIDAFLSILKRFQNLNISSEESVGTTMLQNREEFQIFHPIKILQTLFQDEDMDDVVKAMLEGVTVDLIKYIYKFYNHRHITSQTLQKLKQRVEPFLETIYNNQSQVWLSLGQLLRKQITEYEYKHDQVDHKIEAIELIMCCLDDLFPQDQDAMTKRTERDSLKHHSQKHQQNLNNQIQLQLDEIISILLKNFQKLTNNLSQLQCAIPALKLLKKMLPNIKHQKSKGSKKDNTLLENSIEKFNEFYQKIIEKLSRNTFVRGNSPDLETFKQASEILCDIQQYAHPKSFTTEPTWLKKVIECAKSSKNQRTQLVAVDVLIKIIEPKPFTGYVEESQAQKNILALQQLISPVDVQLFFTRNQDDRLNTQDDFDSNSFEEEETSIVKNIDTNKPRHSIGLSIGIGQDDDEFTDIHAQEGGDSGQTHDYCIEIIGKLWSLLDEPGDHQQIVKLLQKFDLLKPTLFSDVITKDLGNANKDVKRRAVEKFSTFWKLATIKQSQDNDAYMPFQPESERYNEQTLNRSKITRKLSLRSGTKRRDYDALHKMLMILEDKDPTLRLSTRSWLQDSKSDFSRIIDPILKEFMSNNKMFKSFTGQLFFEREYNADFVKENFTKLRNIILTTQEDFVKYICLTNYSSFIDNDFNEVTSTIGKKVEMNSQFESRYIYGIVQLTLQFIMGQYVQVLSEELYQETQVVNASACEFMELLIRSISQYSELCTEMIHLVIDRLVKTLRVAIDNQNDAQQVILLNLLKVILLEHESLYIQKIGEAKKLFEDESFFSCFTDGLRSEGAFVRFHYIQFVQKLVPLMQKVIHPTVIVQHVESLIECFCDLLHTADISAYESNLRAGKTLISLSNGDDEYDEINDMTTINRGDPYKPKIIINQENDILQLVEGFASIIDHCLGTKRQDSTEEEREQEEKLQELGGGRQRENGLFNFFGMFRSSGEQHNADANEQLKEAILNKADTILKACLSCWNDFDVFRAREFFFTTLGMFSYNEEDRTIIEKRLKETGDKREGAETSEVLLLEYFKNELNPIQWKLVESLKPFTDKHPQKVVVNFLKIWLLFMKSSKEQQKGQLQDENLVQNNQMCEKVLQMLLSLQVPAHEVIAGINSHISDRNWLAKKSRGQITMNEREREIGERESSLCQLVYAYLMHNISFVQIKVGENVDDFKDGKLRLYEQILEFIDSLKYSRHPNTTCWLIEIMHILSNKFVAPQQMSRSSLQKWMEKTLQFLLIAAAEIINSESQLDFSSSDDYHLRHLHLSPTVYEMLKRFEFILGASLDEKVAKDINQQEDHQELDREQMEYQESQLIDTYEKGIGSGEIANPNHRNANLTFTDAQKQAYPKLPVFKDTICEELELDFTESAKQKSKQEGSADFDYEETKQREDYEFRQMFNKQDDSIICDYMGRLRARVHNYNSDSLDMNEVHRVCTVVTLRQVLTQLTGKVHSSAQDESQISQRKKVESIIVTSVMNLIEAQIKKQSESNAASSAASSTNRKVELYDQVYQELLTELLRSVTTVQHKVQTHYKNQIEKIFTAKGFFQMSERSLRKWQIIMQQYTTTNTDLWTDLLRAFESQGGLFKSQAKIMESQSDVFRQLSFLIFSTKKDQIREQLDPLLKKMADSFKAQNKEQSFIISLFLLSRILMLRLGSRKLAEALKRLWPHLQAELVATFEDRNFTEKASDKQNATLTSEAIKVVELMSQLNIDEFQINQWMFMFDGFGVKYINSDEHQEGGHSQGSDQFSVISNEDSGRKQIFQPYLIKFMNEGQFGLYDAEDRTTENYEKQETQEIVPCCVNKPIYINNKAAGTDVNNYAIELQKKVDQTNVRIMRIDIEAADSQIEKDFLTRKQGEDY